MGSSTGGDDDFLEDYYDAIVLSTGLGSSILAAALAKAGKTVLHLDRNEHYGEESASFSFIQLLEWAKSHAYSRSSDGGEGDNGVGDADFDIPSSSSPEIEGCVSGAEGGLDTQGVCMAIARALARHELKADPGERNDDKDHDSKENPGTSVGSVGKEPDTTGSATPDDSGGERETTTSTNSVTSAQDVLTSSSRGANGDSSQDTMPTGAQCEEDPAVDKIGADKLEKAASAQLESLDLQMVHVKYHGCHTVAGEPSDDCHDELKELEVKQNAAAHAGRFLREVAPSHPAWLGRAVAHKDGTALHSSAHEAPACDDLAAGAEAAAGEQDGWETKLHPSYRGFRTGNETRVEDLVRLSRSFNIDITSQVILSTGPAVDVLVTSGVASYLEFKDMQALYLASDATRRGSRDGPGRRSGRGRSSGLARPHVGTNGSSGKPSAAGKPAVATAHAAGPSTNGGGAGGRQPASTSDGGIVLSRVPCSKADVFATKLLRPLEKRLLMRFLLFVSDWGLQRAGEDVLGRNEAGLGRGRSLRRPQNREVASSDFDAEAYSGKPFQAFLESCGLPERVRAMVTHALALLPGTDGGERGGSAGREGAPAYPEPTTEEGLEAVYRHLSALGRFGETAFITPLYGVGELPQAFCRMAAVHGAVYVLRRDVKGIALDQASGRCVGVVDETGRTFACGSLVMGGEYYDSFPSGRRASAGSGAPRKQDRRRGRGGRRLLRRVVVASGPVAPDGAGRGLCVLPPGVRCIGNRAAVHAISLDGYTAACPDSLNGACVLHLTTTTFRSDVTASTEASLGSAKGGGDDPGAPGSGGITDQESEVGDDCSCGDAARTSSDNENGRDSVLARAAKILLESAGVKEVWSLGFSWDVQDPVPDDHLPSNVVVCPRPTQELYLHEVMDQTQRAFARLCPGLPFWPPPAVAEDEDDQAEMLRAVASTVEGHTAGAEDAGTGTATAETSADADGRFADTDESATPSLNNGR